MIPPFFYKRALLSVLKPGPKGLEKKFIELASQVVGECGLDIYDVEYIPGSHTLRVFIQNPHTKTAELDDCVKVDRAFTPYFDTLDWIPEEIILEVSSPGIYRDLKKVEHFVSAVGQPINVTIKKKLDGDYPKKLAGQRRFVASLTRATEEGIELEWEKQVTLNLNYDDIKKANVEPDIAEI